MTIAKIVRRSAERQFTVASGAMQITDPCYSKDTWCAGSHEVPNGVWHGHVGYTLDETDLSMIDYWIGISRAVIDMLEGKITDVSHLDRNGQQDHAMRRVNAVRDSHKRFQEEDKTTGKNGAEFFFTYMLDQERRQLAEHQERKTSYTGRVAYIAVRLDGTEVDMAKLDSLEGFEALDIDVGVDSGQAGFFDEARYPEGGSDDHAFYDTICNGTLGDESFANVEFGVASSSGWGDGGYTCYAKKDDAGRTVAMVIVFLTEDGEEEDDQDEAEEAATA